MQIYAHTSVRILSLRLRIDELHDFAYWNYMKTTPERRRFLREKCIGMYVTLFEEFIEMGGQL